MNCFFLAFWISFYFYHYSALNDPLGAPFYSLFYQFN